MLKWMNVGLLTLILMMLAPVMAEVSATLPEGDSGNLAGGISILSHITEDPHPILDFWQRFNPDSATRVVLNPNGTVNGDGEPSILMTLSPRVPLVAWSRNSAEGYDVVLSRFENGAWTTPETLAGGADDELDPSLILDPYTGDVHLFYWVQGAIPKVMHRQADPAAATWSDAEQVSAPSDVACRPAAVFHEGVLRVAYEVHDYGYNQTPRQVVLARKDGSVWTPEVVAISTLDDRIEPMVHSHGGKLWVDWIDASDEASWMLWDPVTGWELQQYEPFADLEEREFHVRGAARAAAIQ